jgi:ketosteroid isomerase-like protein
MARWSRDELDAAFRNFVDATDRCFVTGDLEDWVQCFTDDVTFRDYGYGFNNGWDLELRGRDAVREWIYGHIRSFPNSQMKFWPVPWHIVDVERGWVLCEWRNRMRDPGNGEVFEEKNYTRLKYGGNMQWSFEEDIYNPLRMRTMISLWLHTRRRCEAEGLAMPDPAAADIRQLHVEVQETDADDRWSRAEIEQAVKHFEEVGNRAFTGGDHEEWLQCFTEDVVHRELGFGYDGWTEQIVGRDAVREWIDRHCGAYPINQMVHFPIPWHVIDEERGWVVLEYRNVMADPGDRREYQEKSYTRLKYAGRGQWRFEEDIYSPLRMRAMLDRWLDAKSRQSSASLT